MLQPANAFDEQTRIHLYLRAILARCAESGAELTRSNGRRRTGRNARYCVTVPTGERFVFESLLQKGNVISVPITKHFCFTAANDAEAITKGNARLVRAGFLKG